MTFGKFDHVMVDWLRDLLCFVFRPLCKEKKCRYTSAMAGFLEYCMLGVCHFGGCEEKYTRTLCTGNRNLQLCSPSPCLVCCCLPSPKLHKKSPTRIIDDLGSNNKKSIKVKPAIYQHFLLVGKLCFLSFFNSFRCQQLQFSKKSQIPNDNFSSILFGGGGAAGENSVFLLEVPSILRLYLWKRNDVANLVNCRSTSAIFPSHFVSSG